MNKYILTYRIKDDDDRRYNLVRDNIVEISSQLGNGIHDDTSSTIVFCSDTTPFTIMKAITDFYNTEAAIHPEDEIRIFSREVNLISLKWDLAVHYINFEEIENSDFYIATPGKIFIEEYYDGLKEMP